MAGRPRITYGPDAPSVEERFWSKVWRCTHRWPCKKCCRPWRAVDLTERALYLTWQQHPSFSDIRLRQLPAGTAARWAYLFSARTLLLPGLFICHQCDFAPC
jgi:hypothetical protein